MHNDGSDLGNPQPPPKQGESESKNVSPEPSIIGIYPAPPPRPRKRKPAYPTLLVLGSLVVVGLLIARLADLAGTSQTNPKNGERAASSEDSKKATPAGHNGWAVLDLRDDKTPEVIVSVGANSGTDSGFSITCVRGQAPTVKVKTNESFHKGRVPVLLMLDNGPQLQETWLADGHDLAPADPIGLIKKAKRHQSLRISLATAGEPHVEAEFPLANLEDHIAPISGLCHLGGADEPVKLTSIFIRDARIATLLSSSDSVFETVHRADEVGSPTTLTDPTLSNSLVVTHTYVVDGRKFSLEMRRLEENGSYMVSEIVENQRF
jgi:hypothetical protein